MKKNDLVGLILAYNITPLDFLFSFFYNVQCVLGQKGLIAKCSKPRLGPVDFGTYCLLPICGDDKEVRNVRCGRLQTDYSH